MADNIFNNQSYQTILKRIQSLSANDKPIWGSMNVVQMQEHCSIQLKIALEKIPVKQYEGPFIFRTSMGRWLGLYAAPWPKGSATPNAMNVVKNNFALQSFVDSKSQLITLIQDVQSNNHFGKHPFFGALNKKDWGRLIWKHLDHHLRQFGR